MASQVMQMSGATQTVDYGRLKEAAAQTGSCMISIQRVDRGGVLGTQDTLAVEEPLEIQLAYGPPDQRVLKPISITMRTPGQDRELAVGFLMTEGVIGDRDDVQAILDGDSITGSGSNTVRVELRPQVAVRTASLERNFYMTSSCGICGKASLLALQTLCPPRRFNRFRVHADALRAMPGSLRKEQSLFQKTGGLHAAGLFDAAGNLWALCEDVGRHNAVDKLIGGEWLADRVPLQDRLLLLSGRASFELLQKAVMAGIPMVACVGAPSSLAVRIAQQFDVTLAGFLREDSFNLYHGAERVDGW